MKLYVATLVAFMASTTNAFAPAAFTRGVTSAISTRVFSEPEEEGGLDLDLGEMFEMFDAADKEEDFDKAAARIKSEEE